MKSKHLVYIVIAILLLAFSLPTTTGAASKMPDGTTIANVPVAKKTEKEIAQTLETEITIWKANDDIIVAGEFDQETVSREAFQFDIDATMNELKQRTKRSLSNFFIRPKNVSIPLVVEVDESHSDIQALMNKEYVDATQVIEQLKDLAANLSDGEVTLTLKEGAEIPLETLVEVKWDVPDLSQATLSYIVEELDGTVIPANEMFSFLQSIETPEQLINSRDETSFVGSALYTLFLQANFAIVERHPQLSLPAYGEKGVNAEVNKRMEKDLIVLNNNGASYRLSLSLTNNRLTAALEGTESSHSFEIKIENEKEIKPRTIYRYSKKLSPGETQVVQAGKNGLALDIYRAKYEDGVFIEDELISKDLYLPTPRILLVSTEDPEVDETGEGNVEDVEGQDDVGPLPSDNNGLITDRLPDGLQDTDEFRQIRDLEQRQRETQSMFDRLLQQYQQTPTTTILQQIEALNSRMDELDKLLEEIVKSLIEQQLIDEDFLEQREGGA